MSSEAITRNDLTNILNEVLPPTPSEYRKLLWTNPNSTYSTGTVSLDLSEYDEVEVVFTTDDGLVVEFSASCPVGNSGHGEWWDIRTDLSNYAAINGVTRSFSTSSTGVTFQNGNMFYNGASYNGWASRAVPRRIYGIKYDRVLPPAMDALEWKLKGTASGNNTVAMPSDYNEILLWGSYGTVLFTAVVPKQEISSTAIYPRNSFYYNASTNEAVTFKVASTEAKIESWYYNSGNARTSGMIFKLYYR